MVVVILLIRMAIVFLGSPQLGMTRFYPHFDGLKLNNVVSHPAISRTLLLAIAACLITVTAAGLAMDRGRAIIDLTTTDKAHAPASFPPSPRGKADRVPNLMKARADGLETSTALRATC